MIWFPLPQVKCKNYIKCPVNTVITCDKIFCQYIIFASDIQMYLIIPDGHNTYKYKCSVLRNVYNEDSRRY